MATKNDAPGMKGQRGRNDNGHLRQKRGDTLVSTIEKNYDVNFNVRGDMRLDTLLERKNADSLNDLLHERRSK